MNETVQSGTERAGPETGGGAPRRWLRSPFFWAAVFGLIAIPVMRPLLRHVPDPPPVIAALPDFALVDQSGQTFGTEQLRGTVWVADFFFTSCPSVCPKLTRAMKTLSQRFSEAGVPVHTVSFSVDPETDTPEVLTDYAREYALDQARWHLVTGTPAAMRSLVVDGFGTHVGERGAGGAAAKGADMMDIAHSTHFVLVDGEGRIRGYYGSDEQGIDEVFHRAQHVLQEARDGKG